MANIELLNNRTHKNLRIISQNFSAHGSNIGNVMIMPSEFTRVQREYPIFFRKNPETGQFFASVMLGFTADDNLFLNNGEWQSSHVPLVLARGPFLIGFQEQEQNGETVKNPVIYIDLDDPRISESEGEPIFTEGGERGKFIDEIASVLMEIHHGVEESTQMIDAFMEFNLIEPVNLNIEFDNGEKVNLKGIYTINEETLSALDGECLAKLNKSGYLRDAFSVVNSLDNVRKLIDIRNEAIKNSS